MKLLGILVLSLFLAYGTVAWAVEACLDHHSHSDQATSNDRADDQTIDRKDNDSSVPFIHCVPVNQEVGPMAQAASVKAAGSYRISSLDPSSLHNVISAALRNDLWLDAVCRRIVTVSLPIDLARHLFLSVLQI